MSVAASIEDWITVEETARRTDRSERMVLLWIEGKKVVAVQPGKRQYLVYWPSVVAFRESMKKKKPAPVTQSSP